MICSYCQQKVEHATLMGYEPGQNGEEQPLLVWWCGCKPDPNETLLLELCQDIAYQAHAGQLDKAGKPYIDHVLRVEAGCSSLQARCVALLHDVVEDTEITFATLREAGVPEPILEAVEAITKKPHESNRTYYERVKTCPLALEVKLLDIADNSNPERLTMLDTVTRQRLKEKYARALVFLRGGQA